MSNMQPPTNQAQIDHVKSLAVSMVSDVPANDNAIVSGAGLWLALSVLAAGAGGRTAYELDALLGAGGEDIAVLRNEIESQLQHVGGLQHATALWSRVTLRNEFTSSFPTVGFEAGIDQAKLDAWIANATGGLLTKFPVQITPQNLLVLADALSIRAAWSSKFLKKNTKKMGFTLDDGSNLEVDMMSDTFKLHTVVRKDGIATWTQYTAMSSDGEDNSNTKHGCIVCFAIAEGEASREDVIAATFRGDTEVHKTDLATVYLPKFSIENQLTLNTFLQRLVPSIFASDADFAGVSDEELMVDTVVQDSLIRVDEEGFEAASVTVVSMDFAFMEQRTPELVDELRFDRPFAFSILEQRSGLPIFTGWVANPNS